MFLGLVVLIAGLFLAATPLGAARFANRLRMVPYRSDDTTLSSYRRAGFALAIAGLLLAFVLR